MTSVPAGDLGPELRACPLCGTARPRELEVVLQARPRVELRRCTVCCGSSATRFPTAEYLARLYDPSHYRSDLLAQRRLTARFGRHIAGFVPSTARRIVDYGGNDGGLSRAVLAALRERGHVGEVEFTVVDLHDRPGDGPLRFLTVDAFADDDARYDVVLASAVLEHLPDFRDVVSRLLERAADGAVFYARTPYEVALHRWVPGYRVRWPRHLHDLGPRFWARFLGAFGREGDVLRSGPSPVESELRTKPLRTLVAHVLKAPARVETLISGPAVGDRGAIWPFVGGWEAVLRVFSPRN